MSARRARIRQLRRERPRRPFVRRSVAALLLIVAICWAAGDFSTGSLLTERRRANAVRFVAELRPWPLQQPDAPTAWGARLATTGRWLDRMWRDKGAEAAGRTLAISLVAVLIAGLAGAALSLAAARNFATAAPFLPAGRGPGRGHRWSWRILYLLTRLGLTVARALPEYVWAFLWLALLGPTVWPMILALALHNAGILGKLTAEVVENADPRQAAALRGTGAGRWAIVGAVLVPLALPRFLLYFFYRWETCVRESTVLGMLGMASLGFWIVDSRARGAYDEMAFFVLCGMVLVVVGDLVSAVVRSLLRRA